MTDDLRYFILVINPGSTSTKLALYENEKAVWTETIPYASEQPAQNRKINAQMDLRKKDIEQVLQNKKCPVGSLSAVSARGGPFKPMPGGTYRRNSDLLDDVRKGRVLTDHVSNLGVLLADEIARPLGIPSFFVDPVSVDEFEPLARFSGIPELERISFVHALNIKAMVRCLAQALGRNDMEMNIIAVHLGGGISICAIHGGKIIDVNNANEEGPFSPERAGTLPVSSLAKLCFSGKFTYPEMKHRLVGNAGLTAYLGTSDAREVEKRILSGDVKSKLVYQAMAYQISKEIGAMATVLSGIVDVILITGGLAHSSMLVDWVRERVSFLSPVYVYPGEREMEALALGVLRILRGEDKVEKYDA